MMKKRVSVISLFSGAGLLDLAFESTGRYRTAVAIECDKTFAGTIERNVQSGLMSVGRVMCADVSCLTPARIAAHHGLRGKAIGVIGGPPCQSFSSMGAKKGMRDSRGKLMFEFARWVKELSPSFFVLENVPNFASINSGTPFRRLVREFTVNGYSVSHAVLNAADYGAPTTRKRLFIVGLRGERTFVFPSKTHYDPRRTVGGSLLPWVTAADAFSTLPTPTREPPGEPEGHVLIDHTPAVRQRFRSIPPGGYDYVRKRSRLSPTEPSKSLVAGNWQGARFHIHPIEPRELTNREAARVQGIPDAFLFSGDRVAVARQIANAVPLQLGQAIAEAVGKQLRKRGKS